MNNLDSIKEETSRMLEALDRMNVDEKVEAINAIREMVFEKSPFKNEPVDFVRWVKVDDVVANDYNPNSVAPPEMELLRLSVASDGYTQPIVSWDNDNIDGLEVIDGFHRHRVGKECEDVRSRIHGYLPLVVIKEDREGRNDRIASTIRHNRARGKHRIDSMSDIVVELKRRNWSPKKIGKELGMDQDEVLRLVQVTGLAEMFADKSFSEAWIADSVDDFDEVKDATN